MDLISTVKTVDTGISVISRAYKIKKFFQNNLSGIKLLIKNPIITIKLSKKIYSQKRINEEELFKKIEKIISKEKFNFKEKKKDKFDFSFYQDETVYSILVNPKMSDNLDEREGTIIVLTTKNFLNISYRDKKRLGALIEDFYDVCNKLSMGNIEKEDEEIVTNLIIGIKTKEEEVIRTFMIKKTRVISKKNHIMVCSDMISNLKEIIYKSIKEWYSKIKL